MVEPDGLLLVSWCSIGLLVVSSWSPGCRGRPGVVVNVVAVVVGLFHRLYIYVGSIVPARLHRG